MRWGRRWPAISSCSRRKATSVEPSCMVMKGWLTASVSLTLARSCKVAVGRHQHQAVGAEVDGLQFRRVHRAGHDAQVGGAVAHAAHDVARQPLLQVHGHARMPGQVAGQQVGHELGDRRGVGEDADMAGVAVGLFLKSCFRWSTWRRITRACCSRRWPAGVISTPRLSRYSRRVLSWFSSALMRTLTAASDRWARLAACVRLGIRRCG